MVSNLEKEVSLRLSTSYPGNSTATSKLLKSVLKGVDLLFQGIVEKAHF